MAESAYPINPAQHNTPEYSVSEIAGAVKRMLEDRFGRVRVRGEISGWRGAHSSGHGYFKLKDENAVLEAVCWKGTLSKLAFKMEEGLEVIATGKVTSYAGKSNYQIVIDHMEPAGAGALMAILEKRRAMLAAEGLFDAARKRPTPFFPRVIGVVTSPTGAVIRDIIHRIEERFPVHIIVWPVAVQGEGAAEQIAAAISGFAEVVPKPDVLIVARGGGSVEDLWAFNEEIVVRAAAGSSIPLISAVGHETDTTLIDFASDRRAPTPTAAAEMATPVRAELMLATTQMLERLQRATLRHYQQNSELLTSLARGLPRPATLLDNTTQRLDDWSDRLRASVPALLAKRTRELAALPLRAQLLLRELKMVGTQLEERGKRAHTGIERLLQKQAERLARAEGMLNALNYQSVLKRGFALVSNHEGKLLTSAEAAAQEAHLRITFHDGEIAINPSN